MLNINKTNEYIQSKIKKTKQDPNTTALELYSICDIPVYLLTLEEEKIVNRILCSLLKSSGYITETSITDFFYPGDLNYKNEGYLLIF